MRELIIVTVAVFVSAGVSTAKLTYPIVDTGQTHCYDDSWQIAFPMSGAPLFGQDAQYSANPPQYKDNGDGTISDLVTGLMWQQDPGDKRTFEQAVSGATECRTGGYKDWRLPTIKELYSLIQLNGIDPDPSSRDRSELNPFIDESVFSFKYGNIENGERIIDSQCATSTKYVSTTMGGSETMFGVNFADGRIKGYGIEHPRGGKTRFYTLYVRGNPEYGINEFEDNKDGTITDQATGLTWMKADSGKGMNWPNALDYAKTMEFAGYNDWRLPNAKELQSIIDYRRSPDTTDSAAIDPIFNTTSITNEGGENDFAQYWTSSSHLSTRGADTAVYFAFGRSLGWMQDRRSGKYRLLDVHGAGSQRSDPKVGDASRFPQGRGPQGDVVRIENMVRLVRGGNVEIVSSGPEIEQQPQRVRRGPPNAGIQDQRGSQTNQANRGRVGFIQRFDKNADGKVTTDEFDGPSNRFQELDKDGNQTITQEEAPQGPPAGRRRPNR